MKNLLLLTCILLLLTNTSDLVAQTSKLAGTWEYVKSSASAGQPFFTIVRTIDKKGNYTQVTITERNSFISQKAKFKILSNKKVKESIKYSLHKANTGKTYTYIYKMNEQENTPTVLMIQGGTKIIDGVETIEWREFWRKVEPAD